MACRTSVVQLSVVLILAASAVQAAGVKVLFDPTSPSVGPYPSDALTVDDSSQKTGLRINLPMPDCSQEPSTCAELALVNQLDGFSLVPRIRVRFSDAIDTTTLKSGIFVLWLDLLTTEEQGLQPMGTVTPVNKIEYDPSTNTAYAEPDQVLDQHRRYALIVTSAVRDTKGDPVESDPAFRRFLAEPGAYSRGLPMALRGSSGPVGPQKIVAMTTFTTLSATAWMEKARAAIQTTDIGLKMAKPKSVFNVSDIATITYHVDLGNNNFKDLFSYEGPYSLEGVGRIAYGSIRSPLFIGPQLTIPQTPTGADVAAPAATQEVVFYAYLPATPPPPAGYPVVVYGDGLGSVLPGASGVSGLASQGFAVLAINYFGHGFGPGSTVRITDKSGAVTEVPVPGRGVDMDGNGTIDQYEGCVIPAGPEVVGVRDCVRQSALDQMQLIRAIQSGIDLTGDGVVDLSRNQIHYAGWSAGCWVGSAVLAVEPAIQSAAFNSCGGPVLEVGEWSPRFRALLLAMLAYRQPVLLNLPGPDFDGAFPLRDQPVRVIDVPGAIAIQEMVERIEWNNMAGDPIAFLPHLKWSTLPGVSPGPVLFQFNWGDLSVPNPLESAAVRAANTTGMVSLFHTDLALATPGIVLNPDPHMFIWDVYTSLASTEVSLAIQAQMALFLASDGHSVPDVNYMVRWPFFRDLFVVPTVLPEDLNF